MSTTTKKPAAPKTLDRKTFLELVEEGRKIRQNFEKSATCTKSINANELVFRCR